MALINTIQDQMNSGLSQLGEDIKYNGTTITGFPEIGATLDKIGSLADADQLADLALVGVFAKDVPSPKSGDEIIYNDKTYLVKNVQLYDSLAGTWLLNVVSNVRGFRHA